jgi:hypothetical protein
LLVLLAAEHEAAAEQIILTPASHSGSKALLEKMALDQQRRGEKWEEMWVEKWVK